MICARQTCRRVGFGLWARTTPCKWPLGTEYELGYSQEHHSHRVRGPHNYLWSGVPKETPQSLGSMAVCKLDDDWTGSCVTKGAEFGCGHVLHHRDTAPVCIKQTCVPCA